MRASSSSASAIPIDSLEPDRARKLRSQVDAGAFMAAHVRICEAWTAGANYRQGVASWRALSR